MRTEQWSEAMYADLADVVRALLDAERWPRWRPGVLDARWSGDAPASPGVGDALVLTRIAGGPRRLELAEAAPCEATDTRDGDGAAPTRVRLRTTLAGCDVEECYRLERDGRRVRVTLELIVRGRGFARALEGWALRRWMRADAELLGGLRRHVDGSDAIARDAAADPLGDH